MKVVEVGTVPPNNYYAERMYKCSTCHTVVWLADDDPVEKVDDDQREGLSVTAKCPICNKPRTMYTTKDHAEEATRLKAEAIKARADQAFASDSMPDHIGSRYWGPG